MKGRATVWGQGTYVPVGLWYSFAGLRVTVKRHSSSIVARSEIYRKWLLVASLDAAIPD